MQYQYFHVVRTVTTPSLRELVLPVNYRLGSSQQCLEQSGVYQIMEHFTLNQDLAVLWGGAIALVLGFFSYLGISASLSSRNHSQSHSFRKAYDFIEEIDNPLQAVKEMVSHPYHLFCRG